MGVNQNFKKQKTMDVNQYPVVPNEFVNMGYNSYYSASSMNMGYTVNEYSQNVASTNLYSNGLNFISPMNVKQTDPHFVTYNDNASFFVNEYTYGSGIYEVFDGRKVSPGSGQYRSVVREKQIAYSTGFPTSVNDVQISNASQYSLQPNLQHTCEDAPHQQPNQQTRQLPVQLDNQLKDQSFVFEIPHVSSGKPVPHVAEERTKFNSMIVDDPTGSYEYITKRYEASIITTTKDKLKEPTEVPFEEKTNHENKELSQVVQEVICEFNTVSDDYVSLMNPENVSSVDCGMVLESERTKMQITSLDDNSSGNIKTMSVSSADCEMVSESENSETHVTYFDNKKSGSGFGNIKTPSVPSVGIVMGSESENIETHITSCDTNSSGSGSKNMNIPSASIADLFTESQIKQHLSSFNQNNKAMWSENTEASSDQIPCHLCYDADTAFVNLVLWDLVLLLSILGGGSISKGNLKKAMDEEKEEWVTCDIYIEDEKWVPQTLLRAKDLPRTNLSDHI
ncbi:hypothetical protein Tco_0593097 [Tanacetum coccineum]